MQAEHVNSVSFPGSHSLASLVVKERRESLGSRLI